MAETSRTRGGRTASALILGLLLALGGGLLGAGPAWAGGPTSVLVVDPAAGRAAALYVDDARYQELADAVGAYAAPDDSNADAEPSSSTSPASVSDCFECEVRITWLIHDMSVWRVDRVHLTAGDGIWLQTVADASGGDVFDRPAIWQRPHDAARLRAVLTAMGVVAGASAGPEGGSADPSQTAESGVAGSGGSSAGPPVVEVAAGAGVLGLALGLGAALLLRRRGPRRPRADRIELIG